MKPFRSARITILGILTALCLPHSFLRAEDSSPAPLPISAARRVNVSQNPVSAVSADDPGNDSAKAASISEPLEPVNRGAFWFNHQLYHYVFHPLNRAYKTIFPQAVRTGLSNVIENTEYPVRFVNDLLQGHPALAGRETGKFLYNSTVGVAGIMKPSDKVPSLADLPSPTPVRKSCSGTVAPITVRKSAARRGNVSQNPVSAVSADDPGDDYAKAASIPDPLEPVNRGTFWFNHQLYHYVFHPLNRAYKTIFPQAVRTGLSNVIENTEYPVRFVNDLLQGHPALAGRETGKFLYNSTVGVAGIMKPSDKVPSLADLPVTDTSATFAKWRIPPGCYIVWPVIGPKSLRDTVGFAGDLALNPATWLTYGIIGGFTGTATLAVSAPETAANTSEKVDTYETVTGPALDRYLAVRSAYVQNRKKVESK